MIPGAPPLLCGKVSRDIKQELDKLSGDIRVKKLRWFSECFSVSAAPRPATMWLDMLSLLIFNMMYKACDWTLCKTLAILFMLLQRQRNWLSFWGWDKEERERKNSRKTETKVEDE